MTSSSIRRIGRFTTGIISTAGVSIACLGAAYEPSKSNLDREATTVSIRGANDGFPTSRSIDADMYCWVEIETNLSACANTKESLAHHALTEYGLVFENNGAKEPLSLLSSKLVEDRGGQRAEAADAPSAGRATWLLGTLYNDRNYNGYSVSFSTSRANPCQQAGNYVDAFFNSTNNYYALNDNIESVAPVAPCRVKLWADVNKGGSTTGLISSTADLLGFRNQASSWEFSR